MKTRVAIPLLLAVSLASGCADLKNIGSTTYGETSGSVAGQTDRHGTILAVDVVKVDEDYQLGVGTVVGAVAGGLLGSQIGAGRGRTVATVAGAAAGAAAGTVAESKLKKKDAQSVKVRMASGGEVTILQPVDTRLKNGMRVTVEGTGESARVVPR